MEENYKSAKKLTIAVKDIFIIFSILTYIFVIENPKYQIQNRKLCPILTPSDR